MKHCTYHIYGRVQGVFFRQSSQKEAQKLGLVGYAHNEPDGSVLIEAEGSVEALAAFESWCRKGPANARVDRVEVQEEAVQGYQNFEVRRGD
ncbi:acylphosphatase [Hymenobacter sp. GOD-10R]|uniref:acylphosphatase n=1 Tax=Hymenobacter sp. GOD-10R TaxID=3093922 RepID=UPI002D7989C0|nr:acylphosphatase [Hymenobacter sp. GOD-10R]WRQ27534.1 acylphosphatase [Hymenobacter sp. GOD-10R]